MNRIHSLAVTAALMIPTAASTPGQASPAQTAQFCTAVSQWGLSPAVRELQLAVEQADKGAITAAFRHWTDETQAMVDALPPNAPKRVKRGFGRLNEAIRALARGGSTGELKAYRAARGPVVQYYRRTCV